MYGYEILKRLRELHEGVWSPKTGSLYPSLRRLEEHGLIESEVRDGVSYYSLTAEGEEWTNQALRSLPIDMAMASRWFMRTLREASRTTPEGPGFSKEDFGDFLGTLMNREHENTQSKLDHLKLMRKRMKAFIEEIDELETELEMEERR